jgi:hypothetical protein
MKKLALLILIILSSKNIAFAQKKFNKGDVIVKLAPIALIDYYPAMELGGVYFISDRTSIQLKFSQKTNWIDLKEKYSTKGNRISFEMQRFLNRNLYTGLEFGYMRNKYSDNLSYFPDQNETKTVNDDFVIERQRFYVVPKLGLTAFCSNKISLDIYTGVGLQYQKKEVKDLEFDKSKGHREAGSYFFFGPAYKEKEGIFGKFSLGFMICYKISG